MGKGDNPRPRQVSRAEYDLRWAYYMQGRDGYPKMTFSQFTRKLKAIREKGRNKR